MKINLGLILILLCSISNAQEIFKDEKKYGVSKYGEKPTKENGDSLIFRAEFDEIQILDNTATGDFAFKGKRNDEWSFLTTNKIVNQQRYESIMTNEYYPGYVVAFREGYIDIFSFEDAEFLIRGVKADNLEIQGSFDNNELIMTHTGKEFYGLINVETQKEVLKCEYTKVYANLDLQGTFIAFKDGVTYLHKITGELIFKLDSDLDIIDIHENAYVEDGYDIVSEAKKVSLNGFYYPSEKWFIPPVYNEVKFIEDDPAVAIVNDGKGLGLYFQGKQIVPCEYIEIIKGDKQGTLAIISNKKGNFYVYDDGKIVPKKE